MSINSLLKNRKILNLINEDNEEKENEIYDYYMGSKKKCIGSDNSINITNDNFINNENWIYKN